jgi:hypothetical protein
MGYKSGWAYHEFIRYHGREPIETPHESGPVNEEVDFE